MSRICEHKPICQQPVQHITAVLHPGGKAPDETLICIASGCEQGFYSKEEWKTLISM